MFGRKQQKENVQNREGYATTEQFCQIFLRDTDSFVRLAAMLTGSLKEAEQLVASALEDCYAASVYSPWAESWSRLAVIERCIKAVKPTETYAVESFNSGLTLSPGLPRELEAVLRLDAFRRFVYVLTVLELYSVRDCAILLKTGKHAIVNAQLSAITAVAKQQEHIFQTPNTMTFGAALSA